MLQGPFIDLLQLGDIFFYDEVNIDKMLRFGKNKRQIDANGAINLRK